MLEKNHLKYSASEMYSLTVNFPFVIGDRVPQSNEFWKLYLSLREIFSIVMADSVYKNISDHLRLLKNILFYI